MALILEKFPWLKLNFNFVPSLLLQIEEYLQGADDKFGYLFKKNCAELNEEEKNFIIRHFFAANLENHIKPYPRYYELYKKKMNNLQAEGKEKWGKVFTPEEIRDICCWFQLTYIDYYYQQNDLRVKELISRGSFFSEDDRNLLLDIEKEILQAIIPRYKKLWQEKRIEISTTPFYHPIMPLLYNPQYARTANPHIRDYDLNFSWPEDIQEQIGRAINYMESKFDQQPAGIWPSEGSLSSEIIELLSKNGIRWTATDEKILEKSFQKEIKRDSSGTVLNGEILYKPYRFQNSDISIFFRDQQLSDLIGFTYQHLPSEQAATDLYQRLKRIPDKPDQVVSIILDGENAWEFYPQSGRPFLEKFYTLLSKDPEIETVRFCDLLHLEHQTLHNFQPGSWIYANFDIWMGDEEDRRAWKALKSVREKLFQQKPHLNENLFQQAYEHILIAEGSDWFWWYGKENYTPDLETFDLLFRSNLQKVLNLLQIPVDSALIQPCYLESRSPQINLIQPRSLLEVKIDGEESTYLEWLEAGKVQINYYGGAMHLASPIIHAIYFGFSKENIFLRFDTKKEARHYFQNNFRFVLHLNTADKKEILIFPESAEQKQYSFAARTIIEVAVPLQFLNLQENQRFSFYTHWQHQGLTLERFPAFGEIELKVLPAEFYKNFWQV